MQVQEPFLQTETSLISSAQKPMLCETDQAQFFRFATSYEALHKYTPV